MDAQDLMKLADFWPARILLTAAELDVFAGLVSPAGSADVARGCGADVRGMERLLNALVALELLAKDGELYSVPPGLRDALLPGPQCIVPGILHRVTLWDSWSHLTEVVRTGRPAVEPYEDDERPDAQVRRFIGAMATGARTEAPKVVAALDLAGVTSVLDIGGASGVYAQAFCAAVPGLSATVLDLQRVCEIGRERVNGTEFAARIGFVPGEARTVENAAVLAPVHGIGYGLTFTSSLIHSMDATQVQALFRRMVEWTKPGGRIVVRDFFLDDSRTAPSRAAVFAVNMLVNTPGGTSYTWSECEQWLIEALATAASGSAKPVRMQLPGSHSGLLVATKE